MDFGKNFFQIASISDVEARLLGVEAHSTFRFREGYSQPLRNVLREVRTELPKVSDDLLPSLPIKAVNVTLEPYGIVPSTLVLGEPLHSQPFES